MAELLSLERVSYSYPLPGEGESAALSDLSLELRPGEVLCVAGPNGSGKSTLAQLTAGLLVPTSGTLSYGGREVSDRGGLRSYRLKAGILFQSPEEQLFADTVARDIAFGPRCRGFRGARLDAAVDRAARMVGLDLASFGERSPFTLSEGEKRRAALAGVLALEPEVLVLDEPLIGLDYEGRGNLVSTLDRYREERGAAVLVVTHEPAGIWRLADRFALLEEGRLVRLENRDDLAAAGADIDGLGMRLPPWVLLARELEALGTGVDEPGDAHALAAAAALLKGGR